MITILLLSFLLVVVVGLTITFLVLFEQRRKRDYSKGVSWPSVAVVVAARNEEANLGRCLDCLIAQDYKGGFEIWVGDDDSEDGTWSVSETYADKHERITAVKIQHQIDGVQGKANVLAQVCDQVETKFLLFTDADIEVGKEWASNMIRSALTEQADIVTGVTIPVGAANFEKHQGLDWLFAQSMMVGFADVGKHVTTMGNNMLVRKKAYEDAGGYRGVKGTIAEDFVLFRNLLKSGAKAHQAWSRPVLGVSTPLSSIGQILHQRKRWSKGFKHMPWGLTLILTLQGLYYPALIALIVLNWPLGLAFGVFKGFFQFLLLSRVCSSLRVKFGAIAHLTHELHCAIMGLSLGLFYLMPTKVKWKGRTY